MFGTVQIAANGVAQSFWSMAVLSVLFGVRLHMGVIGITLAMVCDWLIKAVLVLLRWRSGKWKNFKVI